jgi:hypothetical protein
MDTLVALVDALGLLSRLNELRERGDLLRAERTIVSAVGRLSDAVMNDEVLNHKAMITLDFKVIDRPIERNSLDIGNLGSVTQRNVPMTSTSASTLNGVISRCLYEIVDSSLPLLGIDVDRWLTAKTK